MFTCKVRSWQDQVHSLPPEFRPARAGVLALVLGARLVLHATFGGANDVSNAAVSIKTSFSVCEVGCSELDASQLANAFLAVNKVDFQRSS